MKQRWKLVLKVLALCLLLGLTEIWPKISGIKAFDLVSEDIFNFIRPFIRFGSSILVLNIILTLFFAMYRRRKDLKNDQDDTIILGLRNLYYITVFFLTIGAIISLYGIDFKTLFTSLSIIAAAIAIVTRDFIVEILAGLVMSFSGQIAVGDYISVGTTRGRITTLTLTKAVLLNEDDDLVHVPNTKVFSGELVNYTKRMQRRVSIEFEVALSSIKSVEHFEEKLIESLDEFSESVVPNSYSLRVEELRKDSASFKFRYNLHRRSREIEREIRRKTSRAVINYIRHVSVKESGVKHDAS